LGKRIDAVLKEARGEFKFETVLKRLLTQAPGIEYDYCSLVPTEKKAIDRLVDIGMIRVDRDDCRIRFSCDIAWAQTMNRFCGGVAVRGPAFLPEQLESVLMLDFLKSTIPFIDSSGFGRNFGGSGFPSTKSGSAHQEYLYQFELNKVFTRAGNGSYRVCNECNHNLGARRADIRIVNEAMWTDWAVIEVLSHATEDRLVEHVQRTLEVYSALRARHLAVVQFHTDWDYSLPAAAQAAVERAQGGLEAFVVIHDPAFTRLVIRDVVRRVETGVVDIRSTVASQHLKRKAGCPNDAGQSAKVVRIEEPEEAAQTGPSRAQPHRAFGIRSLGVDPCASLPEASSEIQEGH
jgi:hypothetical protein